MSAAVQHQPGDLVRCRGREWIVLPGNGVDLLRLRPLSGAESDTQVIDRTIEAEPVVSATFAPPDISRTRSRGRVSDFSSAKSSPARRYIEL